GVFTDAGRACPPMVSPVSGHLLADLGSLGGRPRDPDRRALRGRVVAFGLARPRGADRAGRRARCRDVRPPAEGASVSVSRTCLPAPRASALSTGDAQARGCLFARSYLGVAAGSPRCPTGLRETFEPRNPGDPSGRVRPGLADLP